VTPPVATRVTPTMDSYMLVYRSPCTNLSDTTAYAIRVSDTGTRVKTPLNSYHT